MHTNSKLQLDKLSALTGANIDSLTQKFYALKERLAAGGLGALPPPGCQEDPWIPAKSIFTQVDVSWKVSNTKWERVGSPKAKKKKYKKKRKKVTQKENESRNVNFYLCAVQCKKVSSAK